MANKLNRYDPVTAIPLLEKRIADLEKMVSRLDGAVKISGDSVEIHVSKTVLLIDNNGVFVNGELLQ